jgi:transcription elongation factor GreA
VTTSSSSAPEINGHDLLRSLGLGIEGPALWGRPVGSNAPGVFVIELPAPQPKVSIDPTAVREWLERVPELLLDGQHPTVAQLQSRLASFWLPGQSILYIGSSGKSVGARLAGMYKTPLGERRPQSAGYWLKTLHDLGKARIWWVESPDAELYEDSLLDEFRAKTGALPYAVLATPSGQRREHGLTNALRDDEQARTTAPVKHKSPRKLNPEKAAPSAIQIETPRRTGGKAGAQGKGVGSSSGRAVAPTHLTPEGLAALQAELEELTTHRRREVIARIKAARELGDLSENADYESARKEQSFLEGRIQQLEQMIKSAAIIDASEAGSEVVLGATVVVETDRHGEETFTIVGSAEADAAAGKISFTSPIGRALMGKRTGETVRVQVPSGALDYRIVEVR